MKMQNIRLTAANLRSDYSIPPDITIEFIPAKPETTYSLTSSNYSNIEKEGELDDDYDSFFNPLHYCAITMEDDERRDEMSHLNAENSQGDDTMTGKFNKKLSKNAESNENSSFVCNGATRPGGKAKKRFSCHICQKTFGWTTDLKRHILIHTGERPFKCSLCFATFTRNFLLQKHKSKIHQCLSPNEVSQLNNNVEKNVMEIKLKMRELEEAKGSSAEENGDEDKLKTN